MSGIDNQIKQPEKVFPTWQFVYTILFLYIAYTAKYELTAVIFILIILTSSYFDGKRHGIIESEYRLKHATDVMDAMIKITFATLNKIVDDASKMVEVEEKVKDTITKQGILEFVKENKK